MSSFSGERYKFDSNLNSITELSPESCYGLGRVLISLRNGWLVQEESFVGKKYLFLF